jgi:hypothetical protein
MFDAVGTIRSIRAIDCADDLAALEAARGALSSLSQYDGAEVWRRLQRVGTVVRAEANPPQADDDATAPQAPRQPTRRAAPHFAE